MQHFNLLEASGLSQKKKLRRDTPITVEYRKNASRLDKTFYDGTRDKGYGGYNYDGRWKKVAEIARDRYRLNVNSTVLIDRCHKGFLVYDLMELIPGIKVYGIMNSEYPINHSMDGFEDWKRKQGDFHGSIDCSYLDISNRTAREKVLPYILKVDSLDLPFKDKYFDSIISIENTCVYNPSDCIEVIKEIVRVSKNSGKNCYIQNDSWENEDEKKSLLAWTFLCKTFLSIPEYEEMYKKLGYNGDYGFTIIQ